MRSKEGDQCVVCMGVLMGKWKHSGPAICPLSGGKRGADGTDVLKCAPKVPMAPAR